MPRTRPSRASCSAAYSSAVRYSVWPSSPSASSMPRMAPRVRSRRRGHPRRRSARPGCARASSMSASSSVGDASGLPAGPASPVPGRPGARDQRRAAATAPSRQRPDDEAPWCRMARWADDAERHVGRHHRPERRGLHATSPCGEARGRRMWIDRGQDRAPAAETRGQVPCPGRSPCPIVLYQPGGAIETEPERLVRQSLGIRSEGPAGLFACPSVASRARQAGTTAW